MSQAIRFCEEKTQELNKELKRLKKKSASLSMVRLAVFALMIVVFYFIFGTTVFYISELTLVIAFALLLKSHEKTSQAIQLAKTGLELAESERKACVQNYEDFDGAEDLIDHIHPYSSDLDLFGKQSIFQIVNRTISFNGRNILSSYFKKKSNAESIIERQESVQTLKDEKELVFNFKASAWKKGLEQETIQNLSQWKEVEVKSYPLIINVLGFISILSTSLLAYFGQVSLIIPLSAFILNMGLIGQKNKDFSKVYMVLDRQNNALKVLFDLIQFIQSSKTDKGQVALHKAYLNESKADDKIKQLNQLFTLLEARLNLVVATVLNGLFLFDNLTVYRLNKWKKENADHIQEWLRIVGEFDALVSLSTLAFNQNENTCFPSIKSGSDYQFQVNNLQHPLIPQNKRIGNDFNIDSNNDLFLVTGSNMAGKSTFLRSVGINMVLAQTGGVVFADKMNYKPMHLFTSMRIFDSIQSGASTFFAEVDRIKSILDEAKSGEIFILLDEILKGTNSKDKYTGSKALIEQLAGFKTSGFIATHDLALGSLEDSYSNIHNRRFEVEIKDGEFIFDYKLKEGVCQTMNATELMKKMGIIIG